jgi:hypothetical protein
MTRTWPLLLATVLFAIACGGSESEKPVPDEASGAERLGREIGETYLLLLDDARAMLGLNLPAEQMRASLNSLRDDYRVRFANLGCLRKEMPDGDQAEVERLADDYVQINGGQDTTWLTQGTQRYAADPQVPSLLAEIQGLRVYAFFDDLARLRPGEVIQCNG